MNSREQGSYSSLCAVTHSAPLVGSLAGVILILVAVIGVAESVTTVVVVAIGILLLEVSIWYAANPIFTNGRQYRALRDELDRFIDSVRQLNRMTTSLNAHEEEIRRINEDMHASVDSMVERVGTGASQKSGTKTRARDLPQGEGGKQAAT